jgi:mono/diheme cytochrome c family protein
VPARIALLSIAITIAACDRDPTGGAADGPAVFHAWCATCHGEHGHPDAGMIARIGVRDLTTPDFRVRVTSVLVATQVRRGSQNKLMPSFAGALSDAQIDAVAAYVASSAFAK